MADSSVNSAATENPAEPEGRILNTLTADEWEACYGVGDHISLGAPMNAPPPG